MFPAAKAVFIKLVFYLESLGHSNYKKYYLPSVVPTYHANSPLDVSVWVLFLNPDTMEVKFVKAFKNSIFHWNYFIPKK